MSQPAVDTQNAAFWDTLCGWNLAQHAGITGRGEDDLRRFDELYLGFYPYLEGYVPEDFGGKKVLEVGLGYGTLGQLIASRNADYYGADIAEGPVANMRRRLSLARPARGSRRPGLGAEAAVRGRGLRLRLLDRLPPSHRRPRAQRRRRCTACSSRAAAQS